MLIRVRALFYLAVALVVAGLLMLPPTTAGKWFVAGAVAYIPLSLFNLIYFSVIRRLVPLTERTVFGIPYDVFGLTLIGAGAVALLCGWLLGRDFVAQTGVLIALFGIEQHLTCKEPTYTR